MNQRGIVLIEALVGILLFAVGVLALVGLQALSISHIRDAKYRADAAFLAEQIIGVMWADTRANLSSYAHNASGSNCAFSGGASGNANVTAWIGSSTEQGSVLGTVPAAASGQQVVINGVNQVSITLCWQGPQDLVAHSYVVTTQINGGL